MVKISKGSEWIWNLALRILEIVMEKKDFKIAFETEIIHINLDIKFVVHNSSLNYVFYIALKLLWLRLL